jgi:hypothetical protein
VRAIALLVFLMLALPSLAEEKKTRPAAHSKPTPQQIRKFNELEKKEQKNKKKPPRTRT